MLGEISIFNINCD